MNSSLCRRDTLQAFRAPARGGTSLIECLVYILLAGMIGILGFEILNRLLRLQGSETRAQSQTLGLERLERQWREDVHRAEAFTISAAEASPWGAVATLTVGPLSVSYSSDSEGVLTRTAREGMDRRATERWELDADATFRQSADRRLLSLELTRRPVVRGNKTLRAASGRASGSQGERIILDAAVGTDRRAARPEGENP